MPPAEFEPAIPASERPQTHALYREATGIGLENSEEQFPSHLPVTTPVTRKHTNTHRDNS